MLRRCILEYLKSKICILVTHQIQFIERATKILILDEGKCLAYGTFQQIQEMGIDFVGLLEKYKQKNDGNVEENDGKLTELSDDLLQSEVFLQSSLKWLI